MTYEQRLEALKRATKKYDMNKLRETEIEQMEERWFDEDLQKHTDDMKHIIYIANRLWYSNNDFRMKLWDSGFYNYEATPYNHSDDESKFNAIQLYCNKNSFDFIRGNEIFNGRCFVRIIDDKPLFVSEYSKKIALGKSFLKEFTNFKKAFYDWFDAEFPFAED